MIELFFLKFDFIKNVQCIFNFLRMPFALRTSTHFVSQLSLYAIMSNYFCLFVGMYLNEILK